jgi:hypothetical protein
MAIHVENTEWASYNILITRRRIAIFTQYYKSINLTGTPRTVQRLSAFSAQSHPDCVPICRLTICTAAIPRPQPTWHHKAYHAIAPPLHQRAHNYGEGWEERYRICSRRGCR